MMTEVTGLFSSNGKKGFRKTPKMTKNQLVSEFKKDLSKLEKLTTQLSFQLVSMGRVVNSLELENKLLCEIMSRREVTECQAGDHVMINYVGRLLKEDNSLEKLPFPGGEGRGFLVRNLGSSTLIEGFESNMVGRSTGTSFTLTLPFPSDYHSKELAGKSAQFCVDVVKCWRESGESSALKLSRELNSLRIENERKKT